MLTILNNVVKAENEKACASGCNAIPEGFIEVPSELDKRIDAKLEFMRQQTTRMGYRFVGRHSAIKVCSWTKESIRGENFCYKKKFYNIESNQCVQMTPAMLSLFHNYSFVFYLN